MDRSEALEIVEMLRTLIDNLDITLIDNLDITPFFIKCSLIKDVVPSSTAFVLSKAIHMIEYLDGEVEDAELNRDANLKLYTAEREKSNQLEKQEQHWYDIAVARTKENDELADQLADAKNELEQEREKSNQLDEKNRKIKTQFELAKKFLHQRREEVSRLKEELRQTQIVKDAQKRVIDEKENALLRLNHEIWELQEQAEYWEDLAKKIADQNGCDFASCYPKTSPNNPANFCGNCRHYAQMGKDDNEFEGICTQHYIKRVDPDDASCKHFKPTYDTRVVIGKPELPCCVHCNHDDCDNCTLCPF